MQQRILPCRGCTDLRLPHLRRLPGHQQILLLMQHLASGCQLPRFPHPGESILGCCDDPFCKKCLTFVGPNEDPRCPIATKDCPSPGKQEDPFQWQRLGKRQLDGSRFGVVQKGNGKKTTHNVVLFTQCHETREEPCGKSNIHLQR